MRKSRRSIKINRNRIIPVPATAEDSLVNVPATTGEATNPEYMVEDAGYRMKLPRTSLASLFGLSVIAPLLLFGLHLWQVERRPAIVWTSGANSDFQGQRYSFCRFFNLLKTTKSNVILVAYQTPEDDSKWMKEVVKETRPMLFWRYLLEYNRREKTLTKRLYIDDLMGNVQPSKVVVWENVDEKAISEIAARILTQAPRKYSVSDKTNTFIDLKKYGAVMHEEKLKPGEAVRPW